MIDAGWLNLLSAIGNLSGNQAAAKLREVGEDDTADAMVADSKDDSAYDFRPRFGMRRDPADSAALQAAAAQHCGSLPIGNKTENLSHGIGELGGGSL